MQCDSFHNFIYEKNEVNKSAVVFKGKELYKVYMGTEFFKI